VAAADRGAGAGAAGIPVVQALERRGGGAGGGHLAAALGDLGRAL
jgi:hypothetical protein